MSKKREVSLNPKSFAALVDEWPGTMEDLANELTSAYEAICKEEGLRPSGKVGRIWPNAVNSVHKGRNKNPKYSTLKAWAKVFNIRLVIE